MRKLLFILPGIFILVSGCAKKECIKNESCNIAVQEEISETVKPPDNVKEDIVKGNSVKESGITNPDKSTGKFDVAMSGYKGEIFIGISDGAFYGTIKFFNWGNGTPQPLKNLRVNEDKVYFIRSITTKEEIEKYGGTATFTQEFYGIFSKDGKIIRGYYRYAGTQDSWEAIRK